MDVVIWVLSFIGVSVIALFVQYCAEELSEWWRHRPISPRRARRLINEQTAEAIRRMESIAGNPWRF